MRTGVEIFHTRLPSDLRRPATMLTVVVLLGALALFWSGLWIWSFVARVPPR
jgi:hypothetical protein